MSDPVAATDTGLLVGAEGATAALAVAPPNPALLLATLSGSLTGQDRAGAAALTGTGAVRYLAAQGARTNVVANPSFETGTTGWNVLNATFAQSAAAAVAGGFGCRVTATGASAQVFCDTPMARWVPGVPHTVSLWVRNNAAAARTCKLRLLIGTLSPAGDVDTVVPPGVWTRVARTVTYTAPTQGNSRLLVIWTDSVTGETFDLDAVLVEPAPTLGAYFDGASPGAAWVTPQTGVPGTAHTSPSVSAAAALVEEATTNAIRNPRFESATTDWAGTGGGVLSRDTTYAYVGTAAAKLVCDGTAAFQGITHATGVVAAAPGQTWTVSVWARGAGTLALQVIERDSGGVNIGTNTVTLGALTDAWTRYAFTATLANAATVGVTPRLVTATTQAVTFWCTNWQLEQKAYATSYCDGALGTGYTWAGTAHASASTRAAARLTVTEAGHADGARGSLAFWFRREADTGGVVVLFTVGNNAAGSDLLEVRIQANDTFVAFWYVGATFTASPAVATVLALGTWYLGYVEWDGANVRVALNAGALTGAAVPGSTLSFASAATDLNVGSNRTGTAQADATIGPLMVFDRPLTAAERSALVRQPNAWPWDAIGGDPVLLSATEAATATPALFPVGADAAAATVAETGTLAVALAAADTPVLAAAEGATAGPVPTPVAAADQPAIGGLETPAIAAALSAQATGSLLGSEATQVAVVPAVLPLASSDQAIFGATDRVAGLAAAVLGPDPALLAVLEGATVEAPPVARAAGDGAVLDVTEATALAWWQTAADAAVLGAATAAAVAAHSAMPAPVVWVERGVGPDPAGARLVWKDRI